jgi:hypothetical protein
VLVHFINSPFEIRISGDQDSFCLFSELAEAQPIRSLPPAEWTTTLILQVFG